MFLGAVALMGKIGSDPRSLLKGYIQSGLAFAHGCGNVWAMFRVPALRWDRRWGFSSEKDLPLEMMRVSSHEKNVL